MIFDRSKAQVIAVLDWELSTLGHPFADVGYQCMQLRLPERKGGASGLRGKDLAELGIPNEEEYVASYCEHMGIERIDNLGFYVAFSFFRLAAIVQGVAKRAVDGNASNKNAAAMGKFVEPMAQMALEAIA
jgi:aminoglycoside phosphotransferase (APT) family kinase protein